MVINKKLIAELKEQSDIIRYFLEQFEKKDRKYRLLLMEMQNGIANFGRQFGSFL